MTCRTCKANKVCDHNKYGFEDCGNYIPLDSVEVVRCEKCEHWERFKANPDMGNCLHDENGLFEFTKPNDFCSYGERKDVTDTNVGGK